MSATTGIIIQHLTDENQSSGRKMGGLTEGKKKQQQKKKPWGAFVTLCEASLLYASLVSQAGLLFILMLPLPLGSGARVPGASGAMQNMACAQHCPLSAC